jgi:hypothetical protein
MPTPGTCEPINPVQFVGGGLFPNQILDGGNQIVLLNGRCRSAASVVLRGGHPSFFAMFDLGKDVTVEAVVRTFSSPIRMCECRFLSPGDRVTLTMHPLKTLGPRATS